MSYRSLTLPHSPGMPRQLMVSRTTTICMAAVLLPGCSFQVAYGAAERGHVRIARLGSMPTLWVGESAFDLLEDEAKQVAAFFGISLPVLPATAGTSLPSPRVSAVAGTFMELQG